MANSKSENTTLNIDRADESQNQAKKSWWLIGVLVAMTVILIIIYAWVNDDNHSDLTPTNTNLPTSTPSPLFTSQSQVVVDTSAANSPDEKLQQEAIFRILDFDRVFTLYQQGLFSVPGVQGGFYDTTVAASEIEAQLDEIARQLKQQQLKYSYLTEVRSDESNPNLIYTTVVTDLLTKPVQIKREYLMSVTENSRLEPTSKFLSVRIAAIEELESYSRKYIPRPVRPNDTSLGETSSLISVFKGTNLDLDSWESRAMSYPNGTAMLIFLKNKRLELGGYTQVFVEDVTVGAGDTYLITLMANVLPDGFLTQSDLYYLRVKCAYNVCTELTSDGQQIK